MANSDYKLAIKIAGMVERSLTDSCNLTKKQLRGIAKEAANANKSNVSFGDAMDKAGGGIDSLWSGATKAIKTTAEALLIAGAAAGTVGGLAMKAGSDFESAFAGVIKTVDATDQQLADLEEGLRDMAKNMPMTAVELAGIAEAAGQLGIETENIESFTKTMADLSVATNLTSDDAATQLARFANITGMSQTEFDRLGSSVVALGNNFAATEADIVSMGMRLAGAGSQVGMSEADIMGLATALSSVGIEAEAGGSAMSKVMINMQLAVENGQGAWKELREVAEMSGTSLENVISTVNAGGKGLNTLGGKVGLTAKELKKMAKEAREAEGELGSWANIANMTSGEFSKAFKEDAAGAISAFMIGLNDTERLGKSAILSLDEMGIKEVRLRDTLLRGANASDLFVEALSLSSAAFEENTALTKEAEQRYQTFESRVDIVKNRVTDAGISLYQSFRDPLSDILDMALNATDNIEFLDPKFIDDMAKKSQESIPTVVRHLSSAKDAFFDFAGPFLAVGDWMIENPDVIAGTLAGIGTTITTLKLVQTITKVTGAMKGLLTAMASNPVTAAIGLTALAAGAIAGVVTKIKLANAEMKRQKLAEAFGEITLSMGELQEMAKQILGEETLKDLGIAMEEIGKLSSLVDDFNGSSQTLKKLNWKINMGMELNESDQTLFKTSIDSMIQNSIATVEQAQYTAHLSVNALFGVESQVGNELIQGFDGMYRGINTEIKELGRQLGEVYSNAMEDGIVDIDEAKTIYELQEKLAKITNQVAQSQVDAKLERIWLQNSGKDLDSESFQNVQKEIKGQLAEAADSLNQSFEYDLGALKESLNRSQSGKISADDVAYLTQSTYDEAKKKLDAEFTKGEIDLKLKGLTFQTRSITDAFSEELEPFTSRLGDELYKAMDITLNNLDYSLNPETSWSYDTVTLGLHINGMDKNTKAALKDLWKIMEPDFNDILALKKKYEDSGQKIPESVQNGITDAATIGMLSGSKEALWVLLGNTAAESEEFQNTLKEMQEKGTYIPETIADGIKDNTDGMNRGVDKLYLSTKLYLDSKFDKFTVNPEIEFKFSGKPNYALANPYSNINKRAKGGIVTQPEISWIAEAGYPEAVVPLDGSQNAKSIWQEAGEALGVFESSSQPAGGNDYSSGGDYNNNESKIVYSPVYQIYGANEEMVRRSTSEDYQKFEQFMKQYQRTQRRLAF